MTEVATRSAERTLSLLAIVCERGRVTLSAASRATGLAPSTALRLLRTLEKTGFVRREESGEFVPGGRVLQFGLRALGADTLVDLVWPAMQRIVALTGESVYLSIRSHADTASYIAALEGTRAVRHRSWVGESIPLAGTAAGAALDGVGLTRGYAVAEGEVESDATAVAVPLRSGGRTLAALSVVAPSFRCTPAAIEAWGTLLRAEAERLLTPIDAIPVDAA